MPPPSSEINIIWPEYTCEHSNDECLADSTNFEAEIEKNRVYILIIDVIIKWKLYKYYLQRFTIYQEMVDFLLF